MDDVIFNGNNTRPARNNAEVAILIDNADRGRRRRSTTPTRLKSPPHRARVGLELPHQRPRCARARCADSVRRRLDRRAFARARAPGRIGEIIQAKPEQRRRVLEEAAGISGLHARRHEAELRLKAAENNLVRAEDVIGQLSGQMEALKKQARQAVRYRTVSSQVRKAEATLYHLRWSAASIEVTEAEHAKDLAVREVAARTEAEAEASKRQVLASASLPDLREAEAAAGAALHRLNLALADLDREEQRAKDRIAELGQAAGAIRRRQRARRAPRGRSGGSHCAHHRGRRDHPR